MPLVHYLEPNRQGRDFVVGDLHGMYSLLKSMLEDPVLNFNHNVDRLFSVGDIVDRGDESVECLALVGEPWFYPVMGNHEFSLVQAATEFNRTSHLHGPACRSLIEYGGKWITDYFDPDNCMIYNPVRDYIAALNDLFYVIVINRDDPSRRVNIVHAEVSVQDYGICTDAEIDSNFQNIVEFFAEYNESPADVEYRIKRSFTEGRSLALRGASEEKYEGLSPTMSGHTPVSEIKGYTHARPYRYNHVFIDTGACYAEENDGLTLVNLTSGERFFMASNVRAEKNIQVDYLEILS